MNIDFDMENRLARPFAPSAGNHAAGPIDWHGLRARLAAAYAAHSVLGRVSACETTIAVGSFDRGSARALAVYGQAPGDGLCPVNPTALANGNSGCDNDAAVAGAYSAGERG